MAFAIRHARAIMLASKNRPKVSVCVVTYNQDKYIRQCLQSIVEQQTNFEIEVIVGDDCSTDGTRQAIWDYERRYPEIIKPIFQAKNVGAMGNYLAVHRSAIGEFVAHIDGDDWMRPNKLVLQHDFLVKHRECPLVAHRVGIWESGALTALSRVNPEFIDLSMLLRNHPMFLHSSIMYRKCSVGSVYDLDRTFIDFFVYISAALTGKIGFLNEVLGDYRRNIGISSSGNLMPLIQAAIDYAEANGAQPSDTKRCRSRSYLSYAVAALCRSDLGLFRNFLSKSMQADPRWIYPRLIRVGSLTPTALRKLILLYKNRPQSK